MHGTGLGLPFSVFCCAVLTTAQGHLSLIVVVGLTPIDIDRRRRGVNVMYVLSSRGLLGASDMIPLSVLLKMEEGNSVVFTVRPGAIPVRVGMGPARTTHGCVRYDVRTPGLDGRPIRNSYRSRLRHKPATRDGTTWPA